MALVRSPYSSGSSMTKAAARPVSRIRKDWPWSLVLIRFMFMAFSPFILTSRRSPVVPAVVTTLRSFRSVNSFTPESFLVSILMP
ncbi:hypothetical protein D3C72_1896250 [compost metagenome]